jgi:hypothetical protein
MDMKKGVLLLAFFAAALTGAFAQYKSLNGMSLTGAAGLYAVPGGRIGWNERADVGLDLGTSYNFFSENPMARAGLSLFNWVEITGAVDFQPKIHDTTNTDAILGVKVQLPTSKTAVAIGGNVQFLTSLDRHSAAGFLYVAVTYGGEFFAWPAETSMALGYTIMEGGNDNIDFGMGFDMILIPDVFKKFVHWIVDFSNFSYSVQALGANAWSRGCLNTGFRVDISALPALNKFKFVFDLMLLDILDSDRSIGLGLSFGIPLK